MYGTLLIFYMRSILNMGTYKVCACVASNIYVCTCGYLPVFSIKSAGLSDLEIHHGHAVSVRGLRLLDSTQYNHIYNHFHKQENVLLIDDHNISYHYQ